MKEERRRNTLVNSGMAVLNDGPPTDEKTVIVLGVARGGTSMAAAALHHLGVFMGPKLSAVYEDTEICGPMEAAAPEKAMEVIARRNNEHKIWGFKRPAAIGYIHEYEDLLRNPEYVVIFRDPCAIANRNQISVGQDLAKGLLNASQDLLRLTEFVAGCKRRMLLISYEKAVAEPGGFVSMLASFVGIEERPAIRAAKRAVRPGDKDYLDQARLHRMFGRLEIASGSRIKGWALQSGRTEPVKLMIRVNQQVIGSVVADMPRPDIGKRFPQSNGNCGFEFALPDTEPLKQGDRVRVRAVGEPKDLANSPNVVAG